MLAPAAVAAPAPAVPTARGGLGAAAIGDTIYVIGGADFYGGAGLQPRTEAFSVTTQSWASLANVPDTDVWGTAVVTAGGDVYALGGWPNGGNRNRRYDPSTNGWTTRAPIPSAGFDWGHAAVAVGDAIYVLGGASAAMDRYDTTTNTWTTLTGPPVFSRGMAAVTDGSKLYVIDSFDAFLIYDIATDTWTQHPGLPRPLDGPTAVFVDGEMFVFDVQASPEADIVFGYEVATATWHEYPTSDLLRAWAAAAPGPDGIHVFGGFDEGEAVDSHYLFDPATPPIQDPRCEDDPGAVCGGDTDDVVTGTDGPDTIFGGPGNDTLSGGDGDDNISGDDGDDNISGDAGNDDLSGGSGNDFMSGGTGDDEILGGGGDDEVTGGGGSDLIKSGGGHDQVDGGGRADKIITWRGIDVIRGGPGNDVIDAGPGIDRVNGGKGFDICFFSKKKEKKRLKNCERKKKRAHKRAH